MGRHNDYDSHFDFDYEDDDTMEIVGGVVGLVIFCLIIFCIYRCCCRNRGQVLAPPASVPPVPPGPNNLIVHQPYYPAYLGAAPPHTAIIVSNSPAAPQQPYPQPAPYPQQAPYAQAYPAPYPQSAPYPQAAPYPTGMPQPQAYPTVPTVPAANALPPTYEQVMGPADTTPHAKQPPYNPYLSH